MKKSIICLMILTAVSNMYALTETERKQIINNAESVIIRDKLNDKDSILIDIQHETIMYDRILFDDKRRKEHCENIKHLLAQLKNLE